jgi:hypothetical protein
VKSIQIFFSVHASYEFHILLQMHLLTHVVQISDFLKPKTRQQGIKVKGISPQSLLLLMVSRCGRCFKLDLVVSNGPEPVHSTKHRAV